MLDGTELDTLVGWCNQRDMRWTVNHDKGDSFVTLEAGRSLGVQQRLLLILGDADMWLEDEHGETLASASDLPALLDALDGGVSEARPGLRHLNG